MSWDWNKKKEEPVSKEFVDTNYAKVALNGWSSVRCTPINGGPHRHDGAWVEVPTIDAVRKVANEEALKVLNINHFQSQPEVVRQLVREEAWKIFRDATCSNESNQERRVIDRRSVWGPGRRSSDEEWV